MHNNENLKTLTLWNEINAPVTGHNDDDDDDDDDDEGIF